MANMGRRAKPKALKDLSGNPGGRPAANEPRPEPGGVTMPRGVLSKESRKAWHELADELERLGLLTVVDKPMFTLLCTWLGVATEAAQELREDGIVTEDDRGRERKNRALTVLRAASTEIRQLSRCFGLSPADRAGLEVPGEDDATFQEVLAMLTTDVVVEGGDGEKS